MNNDLENYLKGRNFGAGNGAYGFIGQQDKAWEEAQKAPRSEFRPPVDRGDTYRAPVPVANQPVLPVNEPKQNANPYFALLGIMGFFAGGYLVNKFDFPDAMLVVGPVVAIAGAIIFRKFDKS